MFDKIKRYHYNKPQKVCQLLVSIKQGSDSNRYDIGVNRQLFAGTAFDKQPADRDG